MTILKCKMCGGTLEIKPEETITVCDSCGTRQTLPKINDDRRANMYDRADHFRRSNDYDKAMSIYEQILNEDNTDAEAYWSIVLCRYGIEYIEDPTSRKRIPTVNRMQFTSIFSDEDFKSSLEYADSYQRGIYEEEAQAIDEIQRGILAISQKEEPFDVFICYKETDSNGRRTQDSVLANDLYHELKKEGFKVFYSRITLEDKLGTAYEPYIFAAINSAKVMVVIGTKIEYFNSVWIKNEWSRYLSLIKKGSNKILIPAYKDIDPYDLPDEFSHLQAQDMTKLGFIQDLIRGIKKIAAADVQNKPGRDSVLTDSKNSTTAPLLRRAFIFLEDGDFEKADEYCEKVLDADPENAHAYLGKLMAELEVEKQEDLLDCNEPFDDNNNYKKALKYADDKLSAALKGYVSHINDEEDRKKQNIYDKAVSLYDTGEYEEAINAFESLGSYKDSRLYLIRAIRASLKGAETGSYIYFGEYEQDNNTSNNKESIEWQVLAKENNRFLVVSRYALDCKEYNETDKFVTWETCTLRTWLNGSFYDNAFSSSEKAMILSSTIANENNPEYGTAGGNKTTDRVFLLSISEAQKYFSSDSERLAKPTAYAIVNGAYEDDGYCFWWLRSPGRGSRAACVDPDGSVLDYGDDVYVDYGAVRPALWIDISNLEP